MLEAIPAPRRLLVVDPYAECERLLPHLRAGRWLVESCELPGAKHHSFDIGLLCLQPEHLRRPECIKQLISLSGTEWIAALSPEVLPVPGIGDFIGEWFFECQTTPLDPARLLLALGRAFGMARLRGLSGMQNEAQKPELLGHSRAVRELRKLLGKLGTNDAPVLIRGESGCGKELVARTLHRHSRRVGGPFVALNCGASAEAQLSVELFGAGSAAGKLAEAQDGSLFLDEVADLPLPLQLELLKRLPAGQSNSPNVRLLAATEGDLEQAVEQGRFSAPLFHWLSQQPVWIAPLRQRLGDIALLAAHFVALYSADSGQRPREFSKEALAAMARYHWPGNVRELATRVRRSLALAEGAQIEAGDLGLESALPVIGLLGTLDDYKRRAEYQALCDALARYSNNLSLAARMLGVSRPTFYRLLHKHQLL